MSAGTPVPSESDVFDSSDSNRSATPLRYAKAARFAGPIKLEKGGELPELVVSYETWGKLNRRKSNAVLVCHALSGDSHAARHDQQDDPGWWDLVIGPGKPIDTDKYFVICSNILGGCRGTTGPNSIHPQTGKRYGADFPVITVEDMVDTQQRLIAHLGITRLHAVVGGSLGGHQTLCWATRHPKQIALAAVLASGPTLTAQALAFDVVGRNAITRDPHFHGGQYYDHPDGGPAVGLALARMLGHITYLSPEAMSRKFDPDRFQPRDVASQFERKFSVGSYLAHQGDKFVERFDANSYVKITMAMDLFDLAGPRDDLDAALKPTTCRFLVLSFTSDWLFPAAQSREIVDSLIADNKSVSYCNVASPAGHDAFLLEDSFDRYGEMLRAFLANRSHLEDEDDDEPAGNPASIFHNKRLDYDLLLELVEPGASVLDLGCGNGEFLARLAKRGHKRLLGVELEEYAILASLRKGLDVVQSDLNEGLPDFNDRQFDYVVLSQTLQSITRTEGIVDEILRVGRRCIVSFPNFAYHKIRTALAQTGRSPASETGLLHYAWYNTPNRRFLSVLDWQEFCASRKIRIHREIFLDTEKNQQVTEDPNLNADLAIFVISRD